MNWSDRSDLWGKTIANQYRVLGLLGSGAVGLVFEVERLSDGAQFALKTLRPNYAHSQDHIQRFCREIQVGYQIQHPNLLAVLDHGRLPDSTPFFVTRKLSGLSLRSLIKKYRRLPPSFVCEIGTQVSSAMAYVHERSIVHRDIKPEHIWVDMQNIDEQKVKLIDFGVCTTNTVSEFEKQKEKGLVFGTPNYASPEQASGNPHVKPVSDIFSLGVTLFEALTGRLPFDHAAGENVLLQILSGRYLRLDQVSPQLPESLCEIVAHCLQKNPSKRIESAKSLSEMLNTISHRSHFQSPRVASAS